MPLTTSLRYILLITLKQNGNGDRPVGHWYAAHVIDLEGVRLVALVLGLPQLGDGGIAGDPVDAVDVAVFVVVMQNT